MVSLLLTPFESLPPADGRKDIVCDVADAARCCRKATVAGAGLRGKGGS